MTNNEILELKTKGYTILRNKISSDWLNKLSTAIDKSFIEHRIIQLENNNDIKTDGVALHVMLNDSIFIDFLKYLQNIGFIKELQDNFFESKCILNSFSALDNLPNQPNFSAIVHRDLRFYSGDFPIMINCLVMVDDFTTENGGTYLLPKSHLEKRKPSDEEFFNNADQATGKRGDILIFNANVWHSSAPNKTQEHRRAIPITISKSFMKQLLDYPRALGYDRMEEFDCDFSTIIRISLTCTCFFK
jgi:ectoine hydroxylase-related dioxygenase (phytanoyl-CoA dioxygenase family)